MNADLLYHVLLALAVVVVFGHVLGRLMALIGQPPVIGEVLSGILLGPSLVGRLLPGSETYLFPESVYTVSVSQSSFRTKVSVGSNPWVTGPLAHNLATICERYGGGGHARVGAISFPIGALEEARKAASEIAAELGG